MSDTGNSSPRGAAGPGLDRLNAGVLQKGRNRASAQHNRSRHRGTPAKVGRLEFEIFDARGGFLAAGALDRLWRLGGY